MEPEAMQLAAAVAAAVDQLMKEPQAQAALAALAAPASS